MPARTRQKERFRHILVAVFSLVAEFLVLWIWGHAHAEGLVLWAAVFIGAHCFYIATLDRRANAHEELQGLRNYCKNTLDFMAIINSDGRYLEVSAALCEVLGAREEDFVGKSFGSFLDPDRVKGEAPTREDLLEKDSCRGAFSYALPGRDTRVVKWVSWRSPYSKMIYVVGHDLTEESRAIQSERLLKERYELALRSAADGMWDHDFESGLMLLSPRALEIIGLPADSGPLPAKEVLDYMDLVSGSQMVDLRDAWINSTQEREAYDLEMIFPDGTLRWVRLSATAVRDEEGNAIRLVGAATDITDQHLAEEQLRKSESALAESQALAKLGSWSFRLEDKKSSWSPEMFRLFGLDPESGPPNGQEYLAFFGKEDVRRFRLAYVDCTERGIPFDLTCQAFKSDGEGFWIHTRGCPEYSADGEIVGMIGTTQDVTEAVNQQRALRESTEHLNRLSETLRDGFWIVDMDAGNQFLYTSKAYCEIYGLTKEELARDRFAPHRLIHPEDSQRVWEALAESDFREWDIEYRILRDNGNGQSELRWIRSRAYPVDAEHAGQVVGAAEDITERKLAENLLQSHQEFYTNLIEASPTGVFVRDQKGRYLLANEAYASIFGVTPADMVGHTVYEMHGTNARVEEFLKEDLDMCASGQSRCVSAIEHVQADGSRSWFQLLKTSVPAPDSDEIVVLGIMSDITHRIETEQVLIDARERAEESSRLKTEFLANISHEFRTPLNGVLGVADLLGESELREEQREYVDIIHSCGESLLSLLNDILDYSQLESGKVELSQESVDLDNLLLHVGECYNEILEDRGLELCLEPSPLPAYYELSVDRTVQVLRHLVDNAIKFTESGRVMLRALPSETGVSIEVEDTGIGIEPQRQEAIFESFTQGDGSATRKHGGVGLGLAIVKRIVMAMGGEISVTSMPGHGSTFRLYLPLKRLDQVEVPSDLEGCCFDVRIPDPYLKALVSRIILGRGGRLALSGPLEDSEVCRVYVALVETDIRLHIEMPDKPPVLVGRAISSHSFVNAFLRLTDRLANDYSNGVYPGEGNEPSTTVGTLQQGNLMYQVANDDIDIRAALDTGYLAEISGEDDEFERDLVATFFDVAPELLELLRKGIAGKDAVSIVHAAHTLKGSSRSIGGKPFADSCEQIEIAARASDFTSCEGLLAKVESSYSHLEAAGDRFLEKRAA